MATVWTDRLLPCEYQPIVCPAVDDMGDQFLLLACQEINEMGGIMNCDQVHEFNLWLDAVEKKALKYGLDKKIDDIDPDIWDSLFCKGMDPEEALLENFPEVTV